MSIRKLTGRIAGRTFWHYEKPAKNAQFLKVPVQVKVVSRRYPDHMRTVEYPAGSDWLRTVDEDDLYTGEELLARVNVDAESIRCWHKVNAQRVSRQISISARRIRAHPTLEKARGDLVCTRPTAKNAGSNTMTQTPQCAPNAMIGTELPRQCGIPATPQFETCLIAPPANPG